MSNGNSNTPSNYDQGTPGSVSMGVPAVRGNQEGYPSGGLSNRGAEESPTRGPCREDPQAIRDHLPEGLGPGVPKLDPSDQLLSAFVGGDFEGAYQAARRLQEAYHELLLEASKLRYQLNFGTTCCQNCTGLHAGPGVVATCFQLKRCDFANITEGTTSKHHLKIIEGLIDKSPSK